MKCPCCQQALSRTRYAGANAKVCENCRGYLIEKRRVQTVKRRVNKNLPELVSEAINEANDDVDGEIRCPKCRNRMDKSLVQKLSFHIDECRNCDSVWLDGGELAKLQLEFETHAQTRKLNSMRERLSSMSPAERKRYEDRIAKLVDKGGMFEQAFGEATCELVEFYYWHSI